MAIGFYSQVRCGDPDGITSSSRLPIFFGVKAARSLPSPRKREGGSLSSAIRLWRVVGGEERGMRTRRCRARGAAHSGT